MAKKLSVLKCKNYQAHLIEFDRHPDRQIAPLWIRSDMAIPYHWLRVDGIWLCSACVDNYNERAFSLVSPFLVATSS